MDNYLNQLITQWHRLKKLEKHYADERLSREQAIQQHLQEENQWKQKGTLRLDDLSIRLSMARKWDQPQLAKIKTQHQLIAEQFPFSTEYKEIKSHSDYLAAKEPEIWKKILPALLEYPAKPYFFVPEKGK